MDKVELRFDHPTDPGIAHIVMPGTEMFGGIADTEIALICNADKEGSSRDQLRYQYAHLFAAAPELLDACRQFLNAHDNGDLFEIKNAYTAAELAVIKAESGI